MSIAYLKKAAKTPETESGNAQSVVAEMLATIEAGGEQSVRDYAQKLDQWTGPILLSSEYIEGARAKFPNPSKTILSLPSIKCAALPKRNARASTIFRSNCCRA